MLCETTARCIGHRWRPPPTDGGGRPVAHREDGQQLTAPSPAARWTLLDPSPTGVGKQSTGECNCAGHQAKLRRRDAQAVFRFAYCTIINGVRNCLLRRTRFSCSLRSIGIARMRFGGLAHRGCVSAPGSEALAPPHSRALKVETVKIHHLRPGGDEVVHELYLCVRGRIHLGDRAQLRV